MDFDIKGARDAGYTDDEIADFLAPRMKFDSRAARQAGYGGADILKFLQASSAPQLPAAEVAGETRRLAARSLADAQTVKPVDPMAQINAEAEVRQAPDMKPAARRGGTLGEMRSAMRNPVQDLRRADNRMDAERTAETPLLERPYTGPMDPGSAIVEDGRAPWKKVEDARAARPYQEAKPLTAQQEFAADVGDAVRGNPLAAGAAAGFTSLGKIGVGAVRAGADLLGANAVSDFAAGASRTATGVERESTRGLVGNEKLIADVTNSIINSAPSIAMGLAGGPAMRTLFATSAANEYNAGRDAGFSGAESAARAGIMGAAEALGEKFGFSQQIGILKGLTKNMPSGEMAKLFGNMLMREVPGEQLTTAIQFLADKAGPAALNPDATIEDYLNAAGETLKVTLGQSAVMGGGPVAINKGREALRRSDALTAAPETQVAEALGQQPKPLRPTELRTQHIARIDDFAATLGVKPQLVSLIKSSTEGIPLAELPARTKLIVAKMAEKGLIQAPPEALAILDEPAMPAQPEAQTKPAEAPSGQATLDNSITQGAMPADAIPAADLLDDPADSQAPVEQDPPASPETVAGAPINRNWTEFSPESGSLGIPREQMPQVPNRGALVKFLNARGIQHQIGMIPAEALKPTQAEFSPQKVQGYDSTRSIIVSSDNRILDGHHAWMAALKEGQPVNAIRFDAPIQDLLRLAHQLPSSTTAKGPTRTAKPAEVIQQPKAADDPAADPGDGVSGPVDTGRRDGDAELQPVGGSLGLAAGQPAQQAVQGPSPVELGAGRRNDALSQPDQGASVAPEGPGSTQAKPAGRVLFRAGRTPNAAADVEVRDNPDGSMTPFMEGQPLLDYDSGDPIVLPAGSDESAIKKAIRDAGAVSRQTNFFQVKGQSAQPVAAAPARAPEPKVETTAAVEPVAAAPVDQVLTEIPEESQKVFRTHKSAKEAAKQLGNTVKLQKVTGGYRIRPMTPKEIQAAANFGKAAKTRGPRVEKDSILTAIGRMGGIDRTSASKDLGVHKDYFKAGPVGAPAFRNGGMTPEHAVEALVEYGYLVPGDGLRELEEKIGEELGGNPQYSFKKEYTIEDGGTMDEAAPEASAEPEFPASWTEEDIAEARAEREALMAESGISQREMNALRGPDVSLFEAIEQTPESHAEGMRAMGFTEQEIQDEIRERFPRAGGTAQVRSAQDPGDGPGGSQAADGTRGEAARPEADEPKGGKVDKQVFRYDDGGVQVVYKRGDSQMAVSMRPDREQIFSADLSVFNLGKDEYPTGTGDATKAYVDAFEELVDHVDKKRIFPQGFITESIQSDNAVAIYQRLIQAGMPFEKGLFPGYDDNAWSMDWHTLSNLDFGSIRKALKPRAGLTLEAQTPEDLKAKAEREAAGAAAEKAKRAANQAAIKAADDAKENKARADATVDSFELGQSAERQMSGMGDMFADAPKAQAEATEAKREDRRKTKQAATTTPTPEPTASIADAGEKIGGARKDLWKQRGLSTEDLDSMSESEGATVATKANVWKPDYESISAASDPVTAAMVKVVYDRLAAKPKADTPQGRRDYVRAMQAVRKVYGSVKSVQEARDAYNALRLELGVYAKTGAGSGQARTDDKDARRTLFSVYKGRADPFVFGYNELAAAKKLVEGGFPGDIEPWTRRFAIRQMGGNGTTSQGVERYRSDSEAAGTPLTEEQIKAGFFEVRTKAFKTVGYAPTRADAEAVAKAIYERTKGDADGREAPDRPHLDSIKREGLERSIDRDVTPEDLMDAYGFRGIEFGNWAAQDERQKVLNLAYDAMDDLAKILKLPPKALGLNGTMGLAFGARGGGKFAAHYEPGKLVINMTKLRGAGSLAHEWAHAVDHYLGELDRSDAYQGKARGASGWYSQENYTGQPRKRSEMIDGKWTTVERMRLENLRPELAAKIDAVMKRLYETPIPQEEAVSMQRATLKRLEQYVASEQDPKIKATYEAELVRNRQLLADLESGKPSDRTVASSYAKEAQKLSGKSSDGYWVRPTEMFARAFESFVFDKLKGMGARSEYLVHGVEQDRYADETRFKGNPYPGGEERQAINAAFDDLVGELKTREGMDGKVAVYEPAKSYGPQTQTPAFKRRFGDSKVVDAQGKPLVVYHGTQRAPDGIAAFGQAPEVDQELQAAQRAGRGGRGTGRLASESGEEEGLSAAAPRRKYQDDRQLDLFNQQLDAFVSGQPDPSQKGEGTAEARRGAADAVRQLRRDGAVLGRALASGLAEKQRTNLVGQVARTPEDLATLAQVYRDPRFETFRVVFTGLDGIVVSQVGLTTRLPGSTSVLVGNDIDGYLNGLFAAARKTGAKSFYLLHNHPSGRADASRADERVTEIFASKAFTSGMGFGGHVVIDTNEYSVIDKLGVSKLVKKDFGQQKPFADAGQWSNYSISSPQDVMRMAQSMALDDDSVSLVMLDNQYSVRGITSIPLAALSGSDAKALAAIRRATLQATAGNIVAVTRNVKAANRIARVALDSIHVATDGSATSIRQATARFGEIMPRDRRARVTEDTSPAFDYLRPVSLRYGADGKLKAAQPAFHGTPYRGIEKFSTDKIGTGEGAQAYGWGLYFASKREIAEYYRTTLTNRDMQGYANAHLNAKNLVTRLNGDAEWAAETLADQINNTDPSDPNHKRLTDTLEMVRSGAYAKPLENPGQLYEVEIPEDSDMLLWDKPLSEQSEKVRKAVAALFENGSIDGVSKKLIDSSGTRETMSGMKLYQWLNSSDNLANDGSGKAASEALAAAGVKGIKYLDGVSRGTAAQAVLTIDNVDVTPSLQTPFAERSAHVRLMRNNGSVPDSLQEAIDTEADEAEISYLRSLKGRSVRVRRDGESFNYVIFSGDDVAITNQVYEPQAKYKDQADIPGTQTPAPAAPTIPPKQRKLDVRQQPTWDMPKDTKFDGWRYKYQDKLVDLKRAEKAILDEGRKIEERFDAYLQEELYHGRVVGRTEKFAAEEIRPLVEEMREAGISMDRLSKYLHARHAEEANKLIAERDADTPDGGSGMMTGDANSLLSGKDVTIRGKQIKGFTPEELAALKPIVRKVDAIIAQTRRLVVSYGLESKATVDGWAAGFKHYVPLNRDMGDEEAGVFGTGSGFSVRGKETKQRTGSTELDVEDILANVAGQRERIIVRGEKNRVAVALAGLVKQNPNPDLWSFEIPPTQRVVNDKTGQVETAEVPNWRGKDNVLIVKIPDAKGNVQERAIVFNDKTERGRRLVAGLKNLDAPSLEGWIGRVGVATRFLANVNTQYNPIFGMVNLTRDLQGAALNLASTPLNGKQLQVLNESRKLFGRVMLAGFRLDSIKDQETQALWKEFQMEGGQTAFRQMFTTTEDRAKAIKKELDPQYWMKEGMFKFVGDNAALKYPSLAAQKGTGFVFDWLSDYNDALENVTRLAAYKVAKQQGLSNQRAASLAKNLTVNFNRKGVMTPQVGALYAFFNAAMQGTVRMGEVLFKMEGGDVKTLRMTRMGAAIVGGGVMLGVLQAAALAAAGFEDDEPAEFVRERNLIIPTGDGKYVTIPMPLGWHVLPNIGRIAAETFMKGGKDAGKAIGKMATMFLEAFNPLGGNGPLLQILLPTVADPVAAVIENKDWTGKPITNEAFAKQKQPGYLNYRDSALVISKWIAQGFNTISGGNSYERGAISPTPDQVQYFIGQLTGGVGRELMKANESAQNWAEGQETPWNKIPLVGRFYGDTAESQVQTSRIYALLDAAREDDAVLSLMKDSGDVTAVDRFLAGNPEAGTLRAATMAANNLKKLRAQKRRIVESGGPRSEVKEIENQMHDVGLTLNAQIKVIRDFHDKLGPLYAKRAELREANGSAAEIESLTKQINGLLSERSRLSSEALKAAQSKMRRTQQ